MSFKKYLLFFAVASVMDGSSIAADSLAVSPLHPKTSDSIRLSIIINSENCCTRNLYDSTAVTLLNDSTIILSFTETGGLCPCPLSLDTNNPNFIKVLTYKRGPLPTGNYSVYEESPACSGQTCSELTIQPLIGKFLVSRTTATIFQQKSVQLKNIGKMSGNVRVYNIRGAIISSNMAGSLKRTSGVYFIKTNDGAVTKLKIGF